MNPVVHFEMPAKDIKRMTDFYAKAFGWKIQMMGAEYGGYAMVQTDETDAQGMLKETNRINGGFYPTDKENEHPSVVLATDDIQASMKKVEEADGKILGEQPHEIPGIGLYISFLDTEGNKVSLLQPSNPM